uniref:Reverse transcriptase domain-containing protein n=1 Tax=Lactuca sativa TaxID=4236 RepID=A0A9R1VNY0_LACSA|nr:hypothetical protein LSAT_V11C400217930 [Lactuca sativa]
MLHEKNERLLSRDFVSTSVKDPISLTDYRPISLIGCMYKIISKILALRLKKVIGGLIGDVQSAYVEGRSILDGPLVINELLSWAKKVQKKVLMFKYLDSILIQLGFGSKWRSWIHGCLTSVHTSVIINGSPTKEFEVSKGVRQGDPLSPFLFIIAMEGINVALEAARDKGIFKGIQIPNNGPILSHLFYADDALFVAKTLSFSGRLTLITSVLGNLPTYFFPLFKAPMAVTDALEKIRRRFLWGGDENNRKIHWVSWDKIVAPKSEGGLGVGSIRTLNTSLLVKWWWRLKVEKNSTWSYTIKGIHNIHKKPHDYLSSRNVPGVWKNIVAARTYLKKHGLEFEDIFKVHIKSRENSMFWFDRWLGMLPLQVNYPSLYELESRKNSFVADRFFEGTFEGHWSIRVDDTGESNNLINLHRDLDLVRMVPGEDQCRCNLDNRGTFSVSTMRKKIASKLSPSPLVPPPSTVLFSGHTKEDPFSGDCADHILLQCPFAHFVTDKILSWCSVQHNSFTSVGELLEYANGWGRNLKTRKRFVTICHRLVWNLRKLRNDRVFKGVFAKPGPGVEAVKSMVYFW